MKKALLFLMLPCFLMYASCKKAALGEDNGCISEFQQPLNPVGNATYARIKTVFQNNGISYEGLKSYLTRYYDSLGPNNEWEGSFVTVLP